jgi:hypothetical protein
MTAIRIYICKDHDEAAAMNGVEAKDRDEKQVGAGLFWRGGRRDGSFI